MPAFRVRSKNIRNAGNHKHISNTICIHVISYNTEILVKLVDFSASENALISLLKIILSWKISIFPSYEDSFGENQYTWRWFAPEIFRFTSGFSTFFASKFFKLFVCPKFTKSFFTSLKYGKQVKIKHWKAEHTTWNRIRNVDFWTFRKMGILCIVAFLTFMHHPDSKL